MSHGSRGCDSERQLSRADCPTKFVGHFSDVSLFLTQFLRTVSPVSLAGSVDGPPTDDSNSDLIANAKWLLPPADMLAGLDQSTNLQKQVVRSSRPLGIA